MYNEIFKIKNNGMKLKVRIVEKGELITSRMLQTPLADTESVVALNDTDKVKEILGQIKWYPTSYSIEDNEVNDGRHSHRMYIEVLSPFLSQPIKIV